VQIPPIPSGTRGAWKRALSRFPVAGWAGGFMAADVSRRVWGLSDGAAAVEGTGVLPRWWGVAV